MFGIKVTIHRGVNVLPAGMAEDNEKFNATCYVLVNAVRASSFTTPYLQGTSPKWNSTRLMTVVGRPSSLELEIRDDDGEIIGQCLVPQLVDGSKAVKEVSVPVHPPEASKVTRSQTELGVVVISYQIEEEEEDEFDDDDDDVNVTKKTDEVIPAPAPQKKFGPPVAGAPVTLSLHSATDIPKMDRFGHADVYVKVFYPPTAKDPVYRTLTKEGTAAPSWEEKATFKYDGVNNTCRVVVMDEDTMRDEFIGQCELDVTGIQRKVSCSLKTANNDVMPSTIVVTVKLEETQAPRVEDSAATPAAPVPPLQVPPQQQPVPAVEPSSQATTAIEPGSMCFLTVHSAADIPKMDRFGHADPYFKVFYPPTAKEPILKSARKDKTASPVWEEQVKFKYDGVNNTCRVVVLDADMVSDEFIGQVHIPCGAHSKAGHDLLKADGTKIGSTLLSSIIVLQSGQQADAANAVNTMPQKCTLSKGSSIAVVL
eukprot:PhM_4_TR5284/c2_g1_i7/m.34569/K19917/DOC2B; double C2-like domain-containing protein beta